MQNIASSLTLGLNYVVEFCVLIGLKLGLMEVITFSGMGLFRSVALGT